MNQYKNDDSIVYELNSEEFLDYVVYGGELEQFFVDKGYEGVPSSYELFWDILKLVDELKDLKN